MELTMEQKEELLNKNDRVLWNVVHKFKRRLTSGGHDDKEDLHSECVVVYVRYLNSCRSEQDMRKIPVLDMINAMCQYVLGEQVLSYPKRTADFRKKLNIVPKRMSYDDIEDGYDPTDDTLDEITFGSFYAGLSDADKRVVNHKLRGETNREAGRALGLGDTTMTRTIQRLKAVYHTMAS